MYVLTLDHSYDQTLYWRGTNKMLGTLAGQAVLTVTDEERGMWREFHKDEISDDAIDTKLDHEMQSAIIRIKCAALYVDMFGQRSSRNHDEWDYIRDVTRKDDIPEEREFRSSSKLRFNNFMTKRFRCSEVVWQTYLVSCPNSKIMPGHLPALVHSLNRNCWE